MTALPRPQSQRAPSPAQHPHRAGPGRRARSATRLKRLLTPTKTQSYLLASESLPRLPISLPYPSSPLLRAARHSGTGGLVSSGDLACPVSVQEALQRTQQGRTGREP